MRIDTKQKKLILRILKASFFFIVLSFLPLIIDSIILLWKEELVIKDSDIFFSGIIGVCVPILAIGFSDINATNDDGDINFSWFLSIIAYTIGIIFHIGANNTIGLKSFIISLCLFIFVILATLLSIYIQRKQIILNRFDSNKARKADMTDLEEGVFHD